MSHKNTERVHTLQEAESAIRRGDKRVILKNPEVGEQELAEYFREKALSVCIRALPEHPKKGVAFSIESEERSAEGLTWQELCDIEGAIAGLKTENVDRVDIFGLIQSIRFFRGETTTGRVQPECYSDTNLNTIEAHARHELQHRPDNPLLAHKLRLVDVVRKLKQGAESRKQCE